MKSAQMMTLKVVDAQVSTVMTSLSLEQFGAVNQGSLVFGESLEGMPPKKWLAILLMFSKRPRRLLDKGRDLQVDGPLLAQSRHSRLNAGCSQVDTWFSRARGGAFPPRFPPVRRGIYGPISARFSLRRASHAEGLLDP
jgi:hypothetical protein